MWTLINMKVTKHFSRFENGFAIVFNNGWLVDAAFGTENYCQNGRSYHISDPPEMLESEDCETCITDDEGKDRTYEIGHCLGLRVDGNKNDPISVLPYLHFNDWLRIVDYVNAIPPRK